MKQTYKLGTWATSRRDPNRDILYSPRTRRIFTPRIDDRPALDFAKNVPTLAAAVERVRGIVWAGDFEPVENGWK